MPPSASCVDRPTSRDAKHVGPTHFAHAFINPALDAGLLLRDVQEAASHADPRATMRYDRGRQSLDRHATSSWPRLSQAPRVDPRIRRSVPVLLRRSSFALKGASAFPRGPPRIVNLCRRGDLNPHPLTGTSPSS
jgi:hypothetical protein